MLFKEHLKKYPRVCFHGIFIITQLAHITYEPDRGSLIKKLDAESF